MTINNKGLRKERDIVYTFDHAKVGDLTKEQRYFLREIYGPLDDEEIIKCDLVEGFQKPDIFIEYKGDRKYISVKTGKLKSVHQEIDTTFFQFLLECGVSDDLINSIKFFFYRDGTLDGTGKTKISREKQRDLYQNEIDLFNKTINKDHDLIEKIIVRTMFKGSLKDNVEADYIYFPEIDKGIVLSKKALIKYVRRKTWFFKHNPHIGPLEFRPHILNPDNEWKKKYAHRMDFEWPLFEDDIKYVFNYYRDC